MTHHTAKHLYSLNIPAFAVREGESPLHGVGLFATREIQKGERIRTWNLPERFKGYNYSCRPNALSTPLPEGLENAQFRFPVFATRSIEPGEEITVPNLRSRPCVCPWCR